MMYTKKIEDGFFLDSDHNVLTNRALITRKNMNRIILIKHELENDIFNLLLIDNKYEHIINKIRTNSIFSLNTLNGVKIQIKSQGYLIFRNCDDLFTKEIKLIKNLSIIELKQLHKKYLQQGGNAFVLFRLVLINLLIWSDKYIEFDSLLINKELSYLNINVEIPLFS